MDWNLKLMSDRFAVKKVLDPFLIPEFEIIIDDSLGFTSYTYLKFYKTYYLIRNLTFKQFLILI